MDETLPRSPDLSPQQIETELQTAQQELLAARIETANRQRAKPYNPGEHRVAAIDEAAKQLRVSRLIGYHTSVGAKVESSSV